MVLGYRRKTYEMNSNLRKSFKAKSFFLLPIKYKICLITNKMQNLMTNPVYIEISKYD